MTAFWLIILTVIVCAAVPTMLIWLTAIPHPKMTIIFEPTEVSTLLHLSL